MLTCISYLLMHEKPPQNQQLKTTAVLFAHNLVGQQLVLGSAAQLFY